MASDATVSWPLGVVKLKSRDWTRRSLPVVGARETAQRYETFTGNSGSWLGISAEAMSGGGLQETETANCGTFFVPPTVCVRLFQVIALPPTTGVLNIT